jgi:hypothetical protein
MHLSDKALLVHLGVSQWTARKLDKEASKQVADTNGATGSVGNFNKTLLPTCNTLADVHRETACIRKDFYHNTLPWGIEGTFILPSANYLAFTTEYRKKKAVWDRLCDRFYEGYMSDRQDAERILGNLFKMEDYPILADLKHKFSMNLTFLPVPTTGDFRVELADGEIDTITAELEERVAESSKTAMKDVWQRLYDKVEWLAERLGDPKNVFHTATYEDAQDLCKMLSRLNFTDDKDLEDMRSKAEQKLFKLHPEAIKNDPDVRRDTAKDAEAIMKQMAGFMGNGGTAND